MKTTTDTFTGKPFRWNSTCIYRSDEGQEIIVPERITSRTSEMLHPSRVPASLLAKLNQTKHKEPNAGA